MKYVARLQTNPSINRFSLKTAPLTLVQAGQSQTFSEKQVLTLRDMLNSLFSIKFEILWSSLKTYPWTQIHLHTPQLPHGSPVLTVFPLSVDQLLGNTVRLNSAYQLYSGGESITYDAQEVRLKNLMVFSSDIFCESPKLLSAEGWVTEGMCAWVVHRW